MHMPEKRQMITLEISKQIKLFQINTTLVVRKIFDYSLLYKPNNKKMHPWKLIKFLKIFGIRDTNILTCNLR